MDIVRDGIARSMTAEERVRFLGILFWLAKVDLVSRSERDRLQPVAEWMQAGEQELAEAMKLAYEPGLNTGELLRGLVGNDKGTLLFREACAVVWADGVKCPEESKRLEDLSHQLGLTEETILVLDTPLACSPEGERRFLEHLGGTSSSGNEV